MVESGISVIVPAYNAEHCIHDCLVSILEQSVLPEEIIVIDDGSTDCTKGVVQGFGNEIIKYAHQNNNGPSAARNKGISLATQPYVAFLDADDLWRPGFLDECLSFLQQHPTAIAVSTGLAFLDMSGSKSVLPIGISATDCKSEPVLIDNFFQVWAEHDHVRTGSSLFRMGTLLSSGGFREDLRIAEDLEFWGYLATFGQWGFIPDPLWVGNSLANAATSGWMEKLRNRRVMCPTVELWEERIIQRLEKKDFPAFKTVRGNVAASYIHSKILGGDTLGAMHIYKKYAETLPDNKLVQLLWISSSCGKLGWSVVIWVVKMKELMKAFRLKQISKKT